MPPPRLDTATRCQQTWRNLAPFPSRLDTATPRPG